MATREEISLSKAQRIAENSKHESEKRAAPLPGWYAEIAKLESEIATVDDRRLTLLADGQEGEADKLATVVDKKVKRAADLRLIVEQRKELIRTDVERRCNVEEFDLANAMAAEAEAACAHAIRERNEAYKKYVAPLDVKIAVAQDKVSATVGLPVQNRLNRAAWIAAEVARLTQPTAPVGAPDLVAA